MRRSAFRASAVLSFCLIALSLVSCQQSNLPEGLYARMKTSKGDILLKLEYQKAPLTVCNFVGLAEGRLDAAKGRRFYDGLTFHRVVADFVVQGGDPNGDGSGDPGYQFANEISADLKHDGPGVLAMANAGPDTNGCQFYITLKAAPWLDGSYSIFGHVVEGMDVVQKIAQGDKISKVEIIRVGAAANAFKVDQATWNQLADKAAAAAKQRIADKRAEDLATIAKNWPDLKPDEHGIYKKILKAGTGASPSSGSTVSVSYKGSFLDGKVFDASDLHGGPIDFHIGVNEVIAGWDTVVMGMKKGEKCLAIFPPEMAYGEKGAGGVIPANAFLVFEIELVNFKK